MITNDPYVFPFLQIVKKMNDMTLHAMSLMAKLSDMDQHFNPNEHMEDIEEMTSLKVRTIKIQRG